MPIFLGTCASSLFTWCLVCTAVSVGIQAASWNFDYENDEEYYEKYYFGIAMYYVFISVWFVSFTYIACMMFRKHFRSIASFQERLLRFQLAEGECYCRSAGHVDTGDLCDREVIARCIRAWFGSVAAVTKDGNPKQVLTQNVTKLACSFLGGWHCCSLEQRFFLKWKEYEERGTGKRARKRNNWKFSWLRKRRKHFRVSVDDKSLRKQLA